MTFLTDYTNDTPTFDVLAPWMNDVGDYLNDLVVGGGGVPVVASDPTLTPGTAGAWINTTDDVFRITFDGVATLTVPTLSVTPTEFVQDVTAGMMAAVGGSWGYNDGTGTLTFTVDTQAADLDDVPDSSTRLAMTSDERDKLGGLYRAIEITWNPGDHTTKLSADEFFSDGISDTATGWTRTIVETAPPNSGSATVSTPRLRVSCPTGLTGASTRIGLPVTGSTSVDDELETVFLSHTVGAQVGHFHRKGVHPSTGNPMAYAFWMDALFLVDSFWNGNTWENDVAGNALIQGSANDSGAADLTGLQHWVDVLGSSKLGAVVTLTVPRDHGIPVGDNILVDCTSITDTAVVVTAVTARTITYTSGSSAATPVPVGGAGQLMSRNTVFPLKVRTRLEGTTLRFKAWPFERMGEPDWSTVNNALTFVNTGTNQALAGESGIIVAHLNSDTYSVDLGSIIWRNRDA